MIFYRKKLIKLRKFIKIKISIFINTFIIIYLLLYYNKDLIEQINEKYNKIQNDISLHFHNKIYSKIKIGIYCYSLKNGGRARLTSLILNYLDKVEIFKLYLFTQKYKEKNEYSFPNNIKREFINNKNYLIKKIKKNKINIFIYQLSNVDEIEILNKHKNIKVIFYLHSCFFYWIYLNDFSTFKYIYKALRVAKYVVSLVPFENDYLFKKWGINSILMSNFLTYDYNYVLPSDLSSNTILMLGRGNDKLKRFNLGIKAMKYIIKEVPDCEMKIISNIDYIGELKEYVHNLTLEDNVKFVGYTSKPEIYFKNSSIHIFPSVSESFGYVLCETKIYGIPNILIGLDYVSISKGGTIIIYDESPKTIGKESIKILKNKKYKKELGREARKSMKKFNNQSLLIRWIKLILSIYNGDYYYQILQKKDRKITIDESLKILNRQIEYLKIRKPNFINISIENIENFTFLDNDMDFNK